MKEIATVDENSVRYRGATEDALVSLGGQQISAWQMNLRFARFVADGQVLKEMVGPVVYRDDGARVYSSTNFERDNT